MEREAPRRLWSQHLANLARAVFWIFLVAIVLLQLFGGRGLEKERAAMLGRFEAERNSRVIALIHRQESASVLGVPVSASISIDDSEAVLRAIRLTPPEQPIDVILHTPGGLVLAAEQIAKALVERKGKVTVFVPHYAMSGGTLIALAADEVVMDPNAVLGPVDPQIGDMPAASIVKAVEIKGPKNSSEEMLILADISQKARIQVASFVASVLLKHMPERQALQVATVLTEGRWTHDFPITVNTAKSLGLKVSTEMPRTVYDLMDLYPQGGGIRPSVWYVPMRRTTQPSQPGLPGPASSPEGKSAPAPTK
ncbi:MAG: ATP-dependent Clp protease proteolytic subunit [Betaproteobacteria bacterium]|nr:ATP-dependent Clp protease proteolytic subunit [Betaproteobacteria bacterium]